VSVVMKSESLRIAVAGASGRMGRMLIEAIMQSADCVLVGALDLPTSPCLGQDACAYLGQTSGVPIVSDLSQGLASAQILIDFTRPEGTLAHLKACADLGVRAVVGTTGFSESEKAWIASHAQQSAVVMAPNMSVGVNVTLKLLQMAARSLSEVMTLRSLRRTTDTRWMPPQALHSKWER